jgi:pimeloyl-ACP methyl ester carboxylesterase
MRHNRKYEEIIFSSVYNQERRENRVDYRTRNLLPTFFPKEWLKEKQNAAYVQKVFSAAAPVPKDSIQHHNQAAIDWRACDRLSNINKPTLVIVGTDDIVRPPANSLMLAEKLPGAWLVQIKAAGHGVMYQYPQQFTAVLETFFSIA